MNNKILKNLIQKASEKNWEVEGVFSVKQGEIIVLVKRESSPFKDLEYSVHTFIEDGFYNGKYDLTLKQAQKEIKNRLGNNSLV